MTANLPAPILDSQVRAYDIEHLTREPAGADEIEPGERRLMSWILPPFQRGEVWSDDQKSRFIESIFLGLNATSYVAVPFDWEQVGDKARRAPRAGWLLDGQQRISSIRDFLADEIEVFSGVRWSDLDARQKRFFMRQPFPCCMVDRALDEDALREIYERLAYGGTPHEPRIESDYAYGVNDTPTS